VALELINTITAQCEAHSPSLVRFAQQFGYSGFKQLQGKPATKAPFRAPSRA